MHLLQRGYRRAFTLIELLLAIMISSFVVIALYGVFVTLSRQLYIQDMKMEMHQNSRFAMEILSRSIRMAGFGSANGYVYGTFGSSGDGSKLPAVIAYDADGNNGQDAITVVYMEPSLVMDSDRGTLETCDTDSIYFNPQWDVSDHFVKIQQYKEGDLLMCQDYAAIGNVESYLWPITADAASETTFGTISIDDSVASLSDYSDVCSSGENLSPVMRCSKGQVITFYIDDDDDGVGPGSEDNPVLMMDLNFDYPDNEDIPLVDNIEDLQFEYCMDDGTDTTDCHDRPNFDDDFASADIENLWTVTITLIARSYREDPSYLHTSTRPKIANHAQASSSDNYFREVAATDVTVRNLRLISAQ